MTTEPINSQFYQVIALEAKPYADPVAVAQQVTVNEVDAPVTGLYEFMISDGDVFINTELMTLLGLRPEFYAFVYEINGARFYEITWTGDVPTRFNSTLTEPAYDAHESAARQRNIKIWRAMFAQARKVRRFPMPHNNPAKHTADAITRARKRALDKALAQAQVEGKTVTVITGLARFTGVQPSMRPGQKYYGVCWPHEPEKDNRTPGSVERFHVSGAQEIIIEPGPGKE